MEHLISDEDFETTLSYYTRKYEYLLTKPNMTPAGACVILFAATVDTALRLVFSEESEIGEAVEELEQRVAVLETDVK